MKLGNLRDILKDVPDEAELSTGNNWYKTPHNSEKDNILSIDIALSFANVEGIGSSKINNVIFWFDE